MKPENWSEIKTALRAAMAIEPARRGVYLRDAVPSDEIRHEVESLLAFETATADFMSTPVGEYSKDFLSSDAAGGIESEASPVGQRVGDYEIIGELGAGGMGAVYLARRADGKFEQTVALKMLRREYNVGRLRRYFRRESRIQAKLEHPNIARLLDVGTTGDGVPFFVLEYVEGLPVDKFCRENNLVLNERLKLFNRICRAVAHAHRHLIVHRDLKPSNILVTKAGEPKLLDFGISKLLDADASEAEKTSPTALGALTPEYASPEQIRGETVSTATDVYSLGVILYKMLTGALPYDFKGKTNGELLRAVTEDEPTAPSLSKPPPALAGGSTPRENPPANAGGGSDRSKLRGDLDNIILKSLRKEPVRRYRTVEEFSADIWRHLDGLPVAARPSTVSYRASKFLRRNRISVIAAAFVLLSLIGGIAVSLQQAQTARAAQSEAERQFAAAKSEEEKSQKISRFMFKVFSYADPAWYAEGSRYGGQARVLDALDDLSGKIETEFADEIDIRAELHHRFGEVYGRVWTYDTEPARRAEMLEKSTFHACRALQLRREFYGDWHELVAKDMYYGAGCIGKTDAENARVWNRAVEMFRGTNPNNLNLPYLLTDYATRLAMPHQAAVHDIYRQAVSPSTSENKYQIAERYYREALPIYRRHYKADNLAIFSTECNLSYVLAMQDKWTDFDEHFAVCERGEPEIDKHRSTIVENPTPTAATTKESKELNEKNYPTADLVRKTLAEKGIVR